MSAEKRLVILTSGRGGVAKSTTARALGEWYRDESKDALLVDGNGSVGQIVQFLGSRDPKTGDVMDPQPPDGVRVFQLHESETARAQLVDVLESGKGIVLVDLPAESLDVLQAVEREYGLIALAGSFGYRLTLVTPITPFQASILNVASMLEFGNGSVDRVVVRNLMFGEGDRGAEDFVLWDGSELEAQAKSVGTRIVDLPKLRLKVMAQIDARSIPFGLAADLNKSPLPLSYRSATNTWIAKVREAFEPAKDVLGL